MTMFPKGGSRPQPPTPAADQTGQLVQYEEEGRALLCVVIGSKKEKLLLLNERSRELELNANRLHRLPGKVPHEHSSNSSKAAYLGNLSKEIETKSREINLEELWQVAQEEEREYSADELSEILFNNNTLLNHAA